MHIHICYHLGDYDWKNGKVSGAIYRVDINLLQLMGDIYSIASYTNPLHPDVFPGICKLEAEVVRITCNLFHGDENSCGTVSYFSKLFFPNVDSIAII